jgi:hypothetical protein
MRALNRKSTRPPGYARLWQGHEGEIDRPSTQQQSFIGLSILPSWPSHPAEGRTGSISIAVSLRLCGDSL